jgi:hypothetical protein
MCAVALDAGLSLHRVTEFSSNLRRAARQRDELLDLLRSDIHHSGTIVRDYLLEKNPIDAEHQKEELERLDSPLIQSLVDHGQNIPTEKQKAFAELTSQINVYWELLTPALIWNTRSVSHAVSPFFAES